MMSLIERVSLHEPADEVLEHASSLIRSGRVVVYPTETLYGIGANALDQDAVARVMAAKKRDDQKPIGVIAGTPQQVAMVTTSLNALARTLIDSFWPGPLTLVMFASPLVPKIITGGSGKIGVRIPSSKLCLELARRSGCVLTATSANIAGSPTGKTVQEIREGLGEAIDLYLDAGELGDSKPSTVVDVTGDAPVLLRDGALAFDEIEKILKGSE